MPEGNYGFLFRYYGPLVHVIVQQKELDLLL